MTEERKPQSPQPAPAQRIDRDRKAAAPRKEDAVQAETAKLADKVNANA
jgi:hypothetical protein